MDIARLRYAITPHLGHVLTPERAARIELLMVCSPARLPKPMMATVNAEQDDEVFELLNERITPNCAHRSSTVALSVRRAGRVIAAVGFTEFRYDSVEMLCAARPGEPWLHRGLIRESFRYAFITAGKPRVWSRVKKTNKAALALNDGLGFVREGIQRQHFGSDDAVLFGMLRSECRWLQREN